MSPRAEAVVAGGVRLTYEALILRANQLAHRLVRAGVGPESRVAVASERSADWIVAELAVMKAGGAFVPLDLGHPDARLAAMIADAGVSLVLTQAANARRGAFTVPVVCVDDATLGLEPTGSPAVRVHADNLMYVIYTSGSTGVPKGVAVTYGAFTRHCLAAGADYAMTSEDVILHVASMTFDAAIEQWVGNLMKGGKIVLSGPTPWTPEEAFDVVVREGVTRIYPPTSHVMNLVDYVERTFDGKSPVRVAWCAVGGEAVPRENVERIQRVFGCRIMNGYGPTETVVTPLMWLADADTPCPSAYAPIGRTVAGRTMYILDEAMQIAPQGTIGELFLGGREIARGYHGQPGLTADRFVPDPFGAEGGRLYRTGDRVRAARDGTVEYVGRADHQVKLRGFRIELGEIEAQLLTHPAVSDAVAVVRVDGGVERLVAYVVPRDGGASEAALRAHLRERLPEAMVPSAVVTLEAFPRTTSGKVDRKALPAPALALADYAAPATATERAIAPVWAELLGVPRVGRHDNFFALGGNSVLVVRMVSALERALGSRVNVALAFRFQTLAALAEAVEQGRQDELSAVVPIPTSTPPSAEAASRRLYAIHPSGGHVVCYRAVAEHLAAAGVPFETRGIQARSFYEDAWIDPSIDAMADAYVEAIEADGHRGPLRVAGWSFGAIVALEVARRWMEKGGEIAFLGLIDPVTLTHAGAIARSAAGREAATDDARWAALEARIARSPLAAKWATLVAQGGDVVRRWFVERFGDEDLSAPLSLVAEREAFNAANCAVLLRDYRLRPLAASATAFWASQSTERGFFPEVVRTLEGALGELAHVVVEGHHDDVVASPRLASAIERAMTESLPRGKEKDR